MEILHWEREGELCIYSVSRIRFEEIKSTDLINFWFLRYLEKNDFLYLKNGTSYRHSDAGFEFLRSKSVYNSHLICRYFNNCQIAFIKCRSAHLY